MNALASTLFVSSSWLLLAFGAPVPAQCETTRIVASDNASFDRFGHAVAVSAGTAIVGAVNHDHGGTDGGGAYVLELSAATWTEVVELIANDSEDGDAFGAAVSVSGERAIVTAPFDDAGALDSGSAYVFLRNGGAWTRAAKLTPSDPSDHLGFGASVSLSGDFAIVGAYMFSDFGGIFGAAYVFERTAQGWGQVAKLTPSDAASDDPFGNTVAISGDYAIVGAAGNEAAQYFGAAYTAHETAKLVVNTGQEVIEFGFSVAIEGHLAVVGGFETHGGFGAAYAFRRGATG